MAVSAKDVLLMHKHNNFSATDLNPVSNFPTEFPYDFDSFCSSSSCSLSSPFESTETESSDEDEFFVGLNRRLTQQLAGEPKKKWVMAGSPKSTLSGIGSWSMSSNGSSNGEVSPPTTPLAARNDTWDLIYAAAGDVARLKMSKEVNKNSNNHNHQGRALLNPANSVKNQNTGFYSNQRFAPGLSQLNQYQHQQNQIQKRGISILGYENGRSCVRPLGLPHSAWPPLQSQQNKHHSNPIITTGGFLGRSGAKKGCTGTGVFLPRVYENAPRSRKRSDCSTVLPAEPSNSRPVHGNRQSNHTQQSIKGALASNHDGSRARRTGLLAQQKGNLQPESAIKYEISLPQEWIY